MGATQVSIKVSEVNWQRGHIDHLKFHKTVSNYNLRIDANNISIRFQIADLLNGQFDEIKLADTSLIIIPKQSIPDYEQEIQLPEIIVPDSKHLPVKKLWIDRLDIEHQRANNESIHVALNGQIEKHQSALTGVFVLKQRLQTDLIFEVSMRDRQINLVSSNIDNPTPWMHIGMQEVVDQANSGSLQLDAKIKFEELSQRLQAWGYAREIVDATGYLQINMLFSAETMDAQHSQVDKTKPLLNFNAKLHFAIAQWQGYANDIVANLDLHGSVKEGLLNWKLAKNSVLQCQPESATLAENSDMLRNILASHQKSQLRIDFPDGLSGSQSVDRLDKIIIDDAIRVSYQSKYKAKKPVLQLRMNKLAMTLQPKWILEAHYQTRINLTKSELSQFKTFKLETAGQVTISSDDSVITTQRNSLLTITPAKNQVYQLAPVSLTTTSQMQCKSTNGFNKTFCEKITFKLSPIELGLESGKISTDNIHMAFQDVSINQEGMNFTANTVINNIRTSNQQYAVNLGQLKTTLHKTSKKLKLQSELQTLNGDIKSTYAMDYYLSNRKGIVEFEILPINFAKLKNLPSRLLTRGQLPVTLLSGVIASHGRIKWQPAHNSGMKSSQLQFDKRINISVDRLAGSYKKTGFIGLQTDLSLGGTNDLASIRPVHLLLDKLDAGLLLTDINMNADFHIKSQKKPELTLYSASAQLLGGEAEAKSVHIDFERSHNPFVVIVNKLDLAKLLEWQQVEGMSGSGYLDAHLPFDLTDNGLSMQAGLVEARVPGGKLRYIPDQRVKNMAESNSNIKMLVDALNNFIYSELSATSNYSSDGKLLLEVALKGKNPDFQQGKAINLNVNIEENILKLLKSLRLGEEISKKIADQLQHQK